MNVYFINPYYIKPEKLNVLLEILKVGKVINLLNPHKFKASNLESQIELYNIGAENKNDLLKDAVYKFIAPISKPIIINGIWTGENVVLDLYKNSYSGNPIHNLVKCKEKNVLILFEQDKRFWTSFSEYVIAILTKYGTKYNYSDRICFCKIDKTLSNSWIYLNKKQKCIISKKQQYLYNPLLSYIHFKTKEIYQYRIEFESIFDFFLTTEGLIEYQNQLFIQIVGNINKRANHKTIIEANRYNYNEYDEFDNGEEELRYIMENGGDWISD